MFFYFKGCFYIYPSKAREAGLGYFATAATLMCQVDMLGTPATKEGESTAILAAT